jgi:N-acetylglucosamine kinase-like BadF-type ATPase
MKYYLGLDAGGTKTFCLIGDDSGNVLGFGAGGPGNYEVAGVPAAAAEFKKAMDAALQSAGITLDQISGIGLGVAGADLPEDYVMLEKELLTPLMGDIPRVFENDSMGGLRGGTKDPFGIVIACGTGCVCAGVNRSGKKARVGGINEDFGDMVSGSSIGIEGLKAVWRSRDGILGPTLLTEKFVKKSGCADIDELFHEMYYERITYSDLEPMAKLVFDAAWEGDQIACDVLEWGGNYLADMVTAAARKLDMCRDSFDVVMTGSVFKGKSPVLKDVMTGRIHRQCPDAQIVHAIYEPVVGALLLGIEIDTVVDDEKYALLSRSLEEAAVRFGVNFQAQ